MTSKNYPFELTLRPVHKKGEVNHTLLGNPLLIKAFKLIQYNICERVVKSNLFTKKYICVLSI
jgi:hypothetical protein